MRYVLGVDFGGGSCKATLLSESGVVAATANTEYPTIFMGSAGREQNPKDWYRAAVKNIRTVLKKSGVNAADVVCLAFDAATHTAVLLDDDFQIVRNAVYWTDTRCTFQTAKLEAMFGHDLFARCKHKIDTIWTFPELLWVKENEPETWARVKKIMFAKDYVRHMFTGDFVTDFIEAEGSMLFDFDTQNWIEEYLSFLGLTTENLPRIVKPEEIVGFVGKKAARESGLQVGTKVICGTTDTAAEVLAAGAVQKGQATVKLATAGRICVISDSLFPDERLINYSHIKQGLFYPGSATKSCAASLRWFRDTFGGDYASMDLAAEKIEIGCGGLIFHPYLSGELTPCSNPNLRACFTGISGTHTKAHFARAVMEGAAYSLLDCKNYLEKRGIFFEKAFIIGGGAKSAFWRSVIADTLGVELLVTKYNDSSFGSAMLAGISAGFFVDIDSALKACSIIIASEKPDPDRNEQYQKTFENYIKIRRILEKLADA